MVYAFLYEITINLINYEKKNILSFNILRIKRISNDFKKLSSVLRSAFLLQPIRQAEKKKNILNIATSHEDIEASETIRKCCRHQQNPMICIRV